MNVFGSLALILSLLLGAALLFNRRTRYVGVFVVALTGYAIAYFIWQSHHWEMGYEKVTLGASEQEVLSLVGKPQRITDGTLWVEPQHKKGSTELVPGCTKEYWYNVFYFPIAYSFCFNENSELIQKYNWILW